MENNYYEEEEINLIDLLLYLLKRFKKILIASLCVAALAGGACLIKGSVDSKDGLKATEIQRAQAKVDYLKEYAEKSIYLNLNPNDVYSSTSIIEVYGVDSEFYLNSINGKDGLLAETTEIVNKYISIYNAINLDNLIDGVNDRYARELIDVTNAGTFLKITAKSNDKDEANALALKIVELIVSNYDQVNETSSHKIRNLTTTTTTTTDLEIEKAYSNYKTELKDAEKALSEVKGRGLVKYSAIGFVGGAFIMCAYYGVLYLIKGYYVTSKTLEDSTGIKCFGTLCTVKNKFVNERVYEDKASALSYIKNTYDLEIKDEKTLLTSSLNLNDQDIEDIVKALGNNVSYSFDYLHNPEVIEKLKDVKNVVLIEKAEVSSISDIKKIKSQLEALNIRLAGFIEL